MKQSSRAVAPRAAAAGAARADAARNRQRLVSAARALYAVDGLGVSMAAVARRAGLGKATLARHFADPDELVAAVFTQDMHAYVRATQEALEASDPWTGFTGYITQVCRLQAQDRGFASVLTLTFSGAPELEELRLRAYEGFLAIIERSRTSGHLREDFASEDLILVLISNSAVVSATREAGGSAWQRLLGHFLRAFANPGAPLPPVPSAPSSAELYAAMNRA